MATPQDCSVGAVAESTYKTYVAPTRTFEFTSETFDWQKDAKQGAGMRVSSRVPRSGRRVVTKGEGKGDLEMDVVNKGMGLLWNAAFGANTVTQISATIAYQHVYTLGDTPPSLTIQKGVPQVDGSTISAMSYMGCMVESMDLESANGEIVTAKFSFDCGDYTNAQSLASLAYPTTPELFHFGLGEVKLGGTVTVATTTAIATSTGATTTGVRDFSLTLNNNLNTERYNYNGVASGQGRKAKPLVGMREITGKFTAEYDATTYRDAYLADTDVPLLVTFTGSTIVSANKYVLQLVIPSAKLDSGTPQSNGGDLITVEHNFSVLDGLSASTPIQLVYVTTDTAV